MAWLTVDIWSKVSGLDVTPTSQKQMTTGLCVLIIERTVVLRMFMFLLVAATVLCLVAFQSMKDHNAVIIFERISGSVRCMRHGGTLCSNASRTSVGGWATSSSDLSNQKLRIDVTRHRNKRAVINKLRQI